MTGDVEWAPGRTVGVVVDGEEGPFVLLAHGAGSDMRHPLTLELAQALVEAGSVVARFDYPYRAEGRRAPDRMPVLEAAHGAVVEWARREVSESVVLAGRSMGGRVGTHLAARGIPCRAVVAFSYPLHPAGKPDRLRIEHLPRISVPMLFVQGTRDTLSRMDLFDTHVRPLPNAEVLAVEGADHGLRVPRVPRAETMRLVAKGTVEWLDAR